jgi:hypothetical protein
MDLLPSAYRRATKSHSSSDKQFIITPIYKTTCCTLHIEARSKYHCLLGGGGVVRVSLAIIEVCRSIIVAVIIGAVVVRVYTYTRQEVIQRCQLRSYRVLKETKTKDRIQPAPTISHKKSRNLSLTMIRATIAGVGATWGIVVVSLAVGSGVWHGERFDV